MGPLYSSPGSTKDRHTRCKMLCFYLQCGMLTFAGLRICPATVASEGQTALCPQVNVYRWTLQDSTLDPCTPRWIIWKHRSEKDPGVQTLGLSSCTSHQS